MGLLTKSFMPACSQARRSSSKALAVIATIGVVCQPGKLRMARVASTPT